LHPSPHPLPFKATLIWAVLAIGSFHLSYATPACAFLFAVHLFCLLQLSRVRTNRIAMRLGMGIGPLVYGPKLLFFWTLFGPSAIALWLVLAFWLGIFLVLMRSCRERFGERWACLSAPLLWTGLEYFRSELYYLRFSWLNAGYAFADSPMLPALNILGMYGLGFVLMSLAAAASLCTSCRAQSRTSTAQAPVPASAPRTFAGYAWALALLAGLGVVTNLPLARFKAAPAGKILHVAGMQLEFPGELDVLQSLNQLHRTHPEAELLVLSEYTFSDGPVPDRVRAWCRTNRIYLAAGAKDELPDGRYFNTIFVVGPQGEILFKQAKKQPIQFFKDGEPASTQRVWDSPWGRLGICICYDLSYTRVVDELVRQGAQALIVPTMDVAEWGEAQHRLHARVAPVRAAEYGLHIFRLASSGISQWADERGRVGASAPFPGDGSILAAELRLADKASRPLDRWLAPASTALTALLAIGLVLRTACTATARWSRRDGRK